MRVGRPFPCSSSDDDDDDDDELSRAGNERMNHRHNKTFNFNDTLDPP